MVCMFLAFGFVMMLSGFHAEIYAVLILLVYFAQTTVVRLDSLRDEALARMSINIILLYCDLKFY